MYEEIFSQLEQLEPRGELRLMLLRKLLLRWGIELRWWKAIPAPPPDFEHIMEAEFFTRKWNATQAQVFLRAVCTQEDDGFPCDARIIGKHEFLLGGISSATARLYL